MMFIIKDHHVQPWSLYNNEPVALENHPILYLVTWSLESAHICGQHFRWISTMRPWHWHWGETMWFFIGRRGQQKHYWSEKKNVLGEWGGQTDIRNTTGTLHRPPTIGMFWMPTLRFASKFPSLWGESIRSATYWNQWVCFFFLPPSFSWLYATIWGSDLLPSQCQPSPLSTPPSPPDTANWRKLPSLPLLPPEKWL